MTERSWNKRSHDKLRQSVVLSRIYLSNDETRRELDALGLDLPGIGAQLAPRIIRESSEKSYRFIQERYKAYVADKGYSESDLPDDLWKAFWDELATEELANGQRRKSSTLYRANFALAHLFTMHGQLSPTRHPEHLRKLRELARRNTGPVDQARPLYTPDAVRLTRSYTCKTTSSLRDATLMAFFTNTGSRSASGVRLDIGDIDFQERGVVCTLWEKTDDEPRVRGVRHRRRHIACFPCLLKQYVERLGKLSITDGPLFRNIDQWGYVSQRAITTKSVTYLLQKGLKNIGFPEPLTYSSHSFRHGLINSLARAGVPVSEIMVITGHRSQRGIRPYLRDPFLYSDRVVLLDDAPRPRSGSVWNHG